MPSRNSMEAAAEAMAEIASSDLRKKLQSANEAETRLLLINKVLSLLGWDAEDYKPERVTSTGQYTDYVLTFDEEPKLVVEAKRLGKIKPFRQKSWAKEHLNQFLLKSCGIEMHDLIQQCKEYCADEGILFAVATTGDIWIILIGPRPGLRWGKCKARIFHSLDDIVTRFSSFYGLLAKQSVRDNSLQEEFATDYIGAPLSVVVPANQLETHADVERPRERDAIDTYFETYMDEMVSNGREEQLDHCYVSDTRLNEYSRELQQLLHYNAIIDEQGFAVDEIHDEELDRELQRQLGQSHPKTILLVGHVGAGKSTFLHQYIRDSIKAKKGDICIAVDLINLATLHTTGDQAEMQRISGMVLDLLHNRFRDSLDPYDPAVRSETFSSQRKIFQLQRGVLFEQNHRAYLLAEEEELFRLCSDRYQHLVCYMKHARKKGYRAWLAFDNVDRGSASYQEFIYAFAHQLSAATGCVTLITLREDTYLAAKEGGFLDVRTSDRVFKINAPELRQVISKRRRYVEWLIDNGGLRRGMAQFLEQFRALNEHIKQLVLGDDDRARMMLTSLSLNSVRTGLSILKDYYVSYHSTFHQSYIYSHGKGGGCGFNMEHEFSRLVQALMLGNSWNYSDGTSEIDNIFEVEPSEQTSHFLPLRILAYLAREQRKDFKRLHQLRAIRSEFAQVGFSKSQFSYAIRRMIQVRLIVSPNYTASFAKETSIRMPSQLSEDMHIALTAKGLYYLSHLARNEYYQVRVGESTPWFDEESAMEYTKCLKESALNQPSFGNDDALLATPARDLFLRYLREQWLEEQGTYAEPRRHNHWLRTVNAMVEKSVFGEKRKLRAAEKPTMSNDITVIAPEPNAGSVPVGDSTNRGAAGASEEQLPLVPKEQWRAMDSVSAVLETVGPMPRSVLHRSRYPVMIIWALELARRSNTGPLTASRIAKYIEQYGGESVANTNLARFFRTQGKLPDLRSLWVENPRLSYSISMRGQEMLSEYAAKPVKP